MAASSKPEMLICHSLDICVPRNDYFSKCAISSAAAPPISSNEHKIMTYPNKSRDMNNIQDSEIYELETNSEPDINDNNSSEIGSSSKSLLSVLKDKKTTEFKKNWFLYKKVQRIGKIFTESVKQSEQLDVAQIDLARQNHIREEDIEIVQFNQLSALDIDEKIGSEEEDYEDREIDESTIKLLLKDYEWDLLKRIVDALKPFEQATKFFSESKYPTLSLIYPIICELQNKFINFSLELNMLLDSENDDDTHSHAPSPLPDLDQIEKQFKIAISDSLNKYWLDFHEVGLVATLLDP
ncbi:12760_t:CDS:2 [Cetraspora pellucida]|uniref:12760_t:CDS:1 n=1 Tax=Cetraspora pellucida TaxID=1433469 RepID=A0A9N8ZYI0_9GLOM|nr:12760_t:CDS:2 [Cetraspora pellucida]